MSTATSSGVQHFYMVVCSKAGQAGHLLLTFCEIAIIAICRDVKELTIRPQRIAANSVASSVHQQSLEMQPLAQQQAHVQASPLGQQGK